MKETKRIVLLVTLALFLILTSSTRQASTSPVASPTAGAGEVPFPVSSPADIAAFGTQTAIAAGPDAAAGLPSPTAAVILETPTSAPAETQPAGGGEPGGEEAGGGQATTEAPPAAEAEQPAPSTVDTPVVERPASWTLQRGEWPICIARRYNLDLPSFLSANGMNMNSQPSAGVVLTIPSSGTWSSNYGSRMLAQHPTNHTVSSGESIYSIACKYGDVTPEAILAVNGLSDASAVQPGMTLRIP